MYISIFVISIESAGYGLCHLDTAQHEYVLHLIIVIWLNISIPEEILSPFNICHIYRISWVWYITSHIIGNRTITNGDIAFQRIGGGGGVQKVCCNLLHLCNRSITPTLEICNQI